MVFCDARSIIFKRAEDFYYRSNNMILYTRLIIFVLFASTVFSLAVVSAPSNKSLQYSKQV